MRKPRKPRECRLIGTLSRPIRFGTFDSDVEGHSIELQIEQALAHGLTPARAATEPLASLHSQVHLSDEDEADLDAIENARIAQEYNDAHDNAQQHLLISIGHQPCYVA